MWEDTVGFDLRLLLQKRAYEMQVITSPITDTRVISPSLNSFVHFCCAGRHDRCTAARSAYVLNVRLHTVCTRMMTILAPTDAKKTQVN